MNLSFVRKHRFALVVGVAAVAMIMVAGLSDVVVASNMGFKMNRQILVGTNLISLPFKTPLAKAGQVCAAFGATGRRVQHDLDSSSSARRPRFGSDFYPCNSARRSLRRARRRAWAPLDQDDSARRATGIIVGSHIPGQAAQILLGRASSTPTRTTPRTAAADICTDLGLGGASRS